MKARSIAAVAFLGVSFFSASGADTAGARECSVDGYRAHLAALLQMVESCKAKAAGSAACAAGAVGPNDLVDNGGKPRLVDYAWLRDTLNRNAKAAKPDEVKEAKVQLETAAARLREDAGVGRPKTETGASQATALRGAGSVLNSVLSSAEFRNISQPTLLDRLLQRGYDWLDEWLSGVNLSRGLSKNLVRTFIFGGVLVGLTLLVWWYLRQLRQQRIAVAGAARSPHPGAASVVDWEQRLLEAQSLAAEGNWREAIHFVYWAAISRLESRGSWPADRARTPREYLQLLPPAHRKRADLALLTRSFERIWYGKRPAAQADFESARSLLDRLVAE